MKLFKRAGESQNSEVIAVNATEVTTDPKPTKLKITRKPIKIKFSFKAIGKAFWWLIIILTILATFIGPLLSVLKS